MDIVLLGPPGAGKGTQGDLLAAWLGAPRVSSGDLFRDAMERDTPLGRSARQYVDRGEYVPDEITIAMVRERIAQPDCAQGVILDGFPRTAAQAEALDGLLEAMGRRVDAALLIEVPTDELIRRLSGRWTCPTCGAVYHEQANPPRQAGVCDRCGSHRERREDDAPEVQRRRIAVYEQQSEPVLEHYRRLGVLCTANGSGSVAEVQQALRVSVEACGREGQRS